MKLPDHLFVGADGHLHDLRNELWAIEPLRWGYAKFGRQFPLTPEGSIALRAAVRAQYVWPGGYKLVFTASDGAMLCGSCVRAEYPNIALARRMLDSNSGWLVDGCFPSNEWDTADDLQCDHCGRVICLRDE